MIKGKRLVTTAKEGGHLSADTSILQAEDVLTHGELGQPAGKAAVGTEAGGRGDKSADLPPYIQPSEKVSYGDIYMTVQLCFTKELLIQGGWGT